MTLQGPSPHARSLTGLAGLNLPPTFISDHCLRTLFYHGPLSPVELATHWRVAQDIAAEVVEAMKGGGLVEADTGQTTFERHGRVRLTALGQAQAGHARQRTWYSGALPVSLRDFAEAAGTTARAAARPQMLRAALGQLFIDEGQADELGQAASGSDVVVVTGAAADEQPALAQAIGGALDGEVSLPYAIFAAGAVLRVFDPQHHRAQGRNASEHDNLDVLRQHTGETSPWMTVRRPVVTLAGGVRASDVVPAYDEDARFYLAPPPLIAFGGLLAVCDADADAGQLAELARLWLVPGKQGTGVVLVRSGERIEVPWRATTLLFAADGDALGGAGAAVAYRVDISALAPDAVHGALAARLGPVALPARIIEQLAAALTGAGAARRVTAARAARYLLDRAAYQRSTDGLEGAIGQAVAFAEGAAPRGAPARATPAARRPRRAA
ncbi:MAG: hypothetical protein ACYDEB_08270 [Dehalococcoidia bacterium]